jgi:hypothetical protein
MTASKKAAGLYMKTPSDQGSSFDPPRPQFLREGSDPRRMITLVRRS